MRKAALVTAILMVILSVEPIAQFEAVEANPFTNIGRPWSPEAGLYLIPNVGIYLE
jgi:hypothetical protein